MVWVRPGGHRVFYRGLLRQQRGLGAGDRWEIGPTSVSPGGSFNPDPAFDHTPTSDNGVAGTVLGGNMFLVRAHFSPASVYEDAPLDSGYSVDNLVPGVPQGLIVHATPGGNVLDWADAVEPDFQYHRVYRGTDPGFVPAPANLVHSTASSAWTDPAGGAFVYKVTTLDANGNETAPASAVSTVGVEDVLPRTLAFGSVAPNPFRGELACAILVPRGGARVSLRVHDLAGRVVRTLADARFAQGRHALAWNGRDDGGRRVAPGIYLLRVQSDAVTSVRRVAFIP